jgi:hypothetical protein
MADGSDAGVLNRCPCGRVVYRSSGVKCDTTGDVTWYLPYVVPAEYPEAYGDDILSGGYPVCGEVVVVGFAVSCDATA